MNPGEVCLPPEIILLTAEHLTPLYLVSLLRAAPGLSPLLTLRHAALLGERGRSILHYLAEEGDDMLMALVLANDSFTSDLKDKDERTPLLRAAKGG